MDNYKSIVEYGLSIRERSFLIKEDLYRKERKRGIIGIGILLFFLPLASVSLYTGFFFNSNSIELLAFATILLVVQGLILFAFFTFVISEVDRKITLGNKYYKLVSSIEKDDSVQFIEAGHTIDSEHDFQRVMANAIVNGKIKINGNKVKLVQGGVEFPTDVGPIDILGMDDYDNLYIFELKHNNNSDKVVGQVMRYYSCIKKKWGGHCKIHAIILSNQVTDKLKHSFSPIPNLSLFKWMYLRDSNTVILNRIKEI